MSISSIPEAIAESEELVCEILARLPPRSLLRCKCVSKRWLCLISSPKFLASHIHQQGTPAPSGFLLKRRFDSRCREYVSLTVANTYGPPSLAYLNKEAYYQDIDVIQSCNGFLLCSSYFPLDFRWEIKYLVCNPTTRQFKTLSFPISEFDESSLVQKILAFDPGHSPHFKIVCVRKSREMLYSLLIYESQTNSWKPSPISFDQFRPYHETSYVQGPVFCRRAIHWCSNGPTAPYFDVDKECVKLMPMPQFQTHKTSYFGEVGGRLCLIKNPDNFWDIDLYVLELKEDYSAWSTRYHVNLNALVLELTNEYSIDPLFLEAYTRILSVIPAEREEGSEMIYNVNGTVVSYNFKDGSVKELKKPLVRGQEYQWYRAYPFIHTLCPI